jgi:hypothetical protein
VTSFPGASLSKLRGIVLFTLAVMAVPEAVVGAELDATIDAAPVFFEVHLQHYAVAENLELMPQGRLLMPPHGEADIAAFSWDMDADASWMMDAEELRYLLPFIASDDPRHRDVARRWVEGWAEAHEGLASPNPMAWEPMTAGIRASVLVYFLRREVGRPDGGIAGRLRSILAAHREYLADQPRLKSNHAVWHAIGLFELSRVFGDSSIRELALSRLLDIATTQVSADGCHKEHAPMYHFVVLEWLDQIVEYLDGIPGFDWPGLETLRLVRERMIASGYFLQDHGGNIIPIGDSVRRPVPAVGLAAMAPAHNLFFDREAGYACYKEPSSPRSGRQLVFNIQDRPRPFPFHFHDDAAALVYCYRGESILGDAGVFAYDDSEQRRYVTSARAHNIAGPVQMLGLPAHQPATSYAVNPAAEYDGDGVVLRASRRFGQEQLDRTVRIPADSPAVVIEDVLTGCSEMNLLWHLGPDVESVTVDSTFSGERNDRAWILRTRAGRELRLAVTFPAGSAVGRFHSAVVSGATDPMQGWYSPSWKSLVATPTVVTGFFSCQRNVVRTEVSLVREGP